MHGSSRYSVQLDVFVYKDSARMPGFVVENNIFKTPGYF